MSHADDGAVVQASSGKPLFYKRLDGSTVQYVGRDTKTNLPIDSDGLTSLLDAAGYLGIEVKRLRGYIFRNWLCDPIGDADRVYPWSLGQRRDDPSSSAALVKEIG